MVRVRTKHVKPNAVVIQILTAPSHLHPHLQLTALVAGRTLLQSPGVAYSVSLLPLIKPMMCRSSFRYIGGSGLKLYPDKLHNLLYW